LLALAFAIVAFAFGPFLSKKNSFPFLVFAHLVFFKELSHEIFKGEAL